MRAVLATRATSASTAVAVVLAFAILTSVWIVIHTGRYQAELPDTRLYQLYGERVLRGEVPYRDFGVGYPPGALPVFIAPAVGPSESYRNLFEFVMLLCAEAALAFLALALASAGAAKQRVYAAVLFAALAPLALGSVVLSRYDLWPAALATGAIAAFVAGRALLGAGVLAAAAATKLYPIVVVPLVLSHVWRQRGPRAALAVLVVFALVFAAATVPFTLGSSELEASARGQTLGRMLQVESLGAAVLLAAHQLGVYSAEIIATAAGHAMSGALASNVADVATVLQLLAVVVVAVALLRGPATSDRLLLASAAAVTAFVAFGRVFSPQYLVWLIPLVPAVAGRLGVAASALLATALVLTQLWFPSRYFDVVALEDVTWLVLARDLVLVFLYGLLLAGLLRRGGGAETARAPT